MCDKKHITNTVNLIENSDINAADLTQKLLLKNKPVRTKLWKLDHNYHCAVIGTCLTLAEVKKLLHSLQIDFSQCNTYEIHTTIVTMISYNDYRSKKIQSYLDKKFSTIIQKTKKMNIQSLKEEWKNVLNTGDLVGTFWAIMSHPNTNSDMKKDFYGDIHMLSHLSGASNRVNLKRLNQLERERVELIRDASFKQTKNYRQKADNLHLKKTINILESKNMELKHQLFAIQKDNIELKQLQNTKNHHLLKLQLEKLTRKNNVQAREIKKQQRSREQSDNLVAQLKKQQLTNVSEISIYKEEANYLQYLLTQNKKSDYCQFKKQDLCGQCVLYVGGKKNLIPHYRELIEENAGVFLHHDGGLEKNTQDLAQLLSRADIVLFPSDCISHDAYWKIKRSCKKQQKQYEYLNSPGLCSLSSVLDKIGHLPLRRETVKGTSIN
ncbi:MAG: DUF2325 domain-containing protein [Methylococcales bacterium]|nr:DUF2325 domain-containing protein [Methylococcales bacterium]